MLVVIGLCGVASIILLVIRHNFLLPARPGMDAMEFPVWSSSGEYIAYECVYFTEEYLWASISLDGGLQEYPVQDICIQKANGDGFERLTSTGEMRYPAWSPNSQYLAWIHACKSVVVWDSVTKALRYYPYTGIDLYHMPDSSQRIEWSLDGSKLYLQDLGAEMDIETGVFTLHDYSLADQVSCCPMLSPTGEHIAYIEFEDTYENQSRSTWLTILEDNRIKIKEMSHEAGIGSLAWSNDGEMIAWFAYPTGWSDINDDGTNIDTRRWVAITHVPSNQTQFLDAGEVVMFDYPVWSPTDHAIALKSYDELIILNLDIKYSPFDVRIKDQHSLPFVDVLHRQPITWSPSGDSIAYSSRDGNIHIVHLNGSYSILSEP